MRHQPAAGVAAGVDFVAPATERASKQHKLNKTSMAMRVRAVMINTVGNVVRRGRIDSRLLIGSVVEFGEVVPTLILVEIGEVVPTSRSGTQQASKAEIAEPK